jgi:hypothetical protein
MLFFLVYIFKQYDESMNITLYWDIPSPSNIKTNILLAAAWS